MKIKAAILSALIAWTWSPPALAGPIAEAAEEAERLHAEGKTVEALDALNAAIDTIWRESPLVFRQVVLVESSAGYGRYQERTNRVFRPDEEMRIHVEPVGYGYGATADGATIDFNVDLAIENMTGQVLGEARDVLEFSTETHPNRRDLGITFSIKAPYVRPGDYKAVFTVRDRNSDKSGTFEVPFTVAPPVFQDSGPQASGQNTPAPAGAAAEPTVTKSEPSPPASLPGQGGAGANAQ